jgi:CBS domain containing-hemolysin-like protein
MTDDRSRNGQIGESSESDGARERWYDRLLTRVGLKSRDSIRDDLEEALAEVGEENFSPQERAMLKNVLGFHRIRVDDVMVPRVDIVSVSFEATLGELLALFRTAGHSRLPVFGETLDDPRGMVHIRDFLDYIAAKAEARPRRRRNSDPKIPDPKIPDSKIPDSKIPDSKIPDSRTPVSRAPEGADAPVPPPSLGDVDLSVTLASARILRPVLFVPPSMPAVDLLVRMQATRTHMALVIDEYGGTDGLVSIEDLVEMVVGDIEDEHDVEAGRMIVREGDTYVADARASLEEVSEAVGADLAIGDMAEEVDTVGGLIVTLAGRVPSRGELIAGPENLEFEVLDADPRRVKRVRIHRRAEGAPRLVPPGRPGVETGDGAKAQSLAPAAPVPPPSGTETMVAATPLAAGAAVPEPAADAGERRASVRRA